MNLIDGFVTNVISEPVYIDKYPDVQWWEVTVNYVSEGWPGRTALTFQTKEEADAVQKGYHFLA